MCGCRRMQYQTGDIFLIDSNKSGARVVKFLMTAPTVWQHFWRKIRGTQEVVKYYHVAMIYDPDTLAEQQWKVQLVKIPIPAHFAVFRYKNLTPEIAERLKNEVNKDIGKNWDILNVLGKTLTWLTGIRLFAQFIQWPEQEICVDRVAEWYYRVTGIKFGGFTIEEVTTHSMYKWLLAHPQYFELLSET